MPDCVLDASVVAYSNGDLGGRRAGNRLHRRLVVIEHVCAGHFRVRYNAKLLREYNQLIGTCRNDVIELLFAVLDSEQAVRVPRNTLSRQHHANAKRCRWPDHDQHLLAAALDGNAPSLFVTEEQLASCGPKVLTHFSIRVKRLA